MPTCTRHRFPLQRLAVAATLACGALLTACGGGADDTPPPTVSPLSQSDATADAANATATGVDAATAMDSVVDTTSLVAQATASVASASAGRMQAQSAGAATAISPITDVTVDCAGGGTAVLSISGGTGASEINGQLDAGEHYSVTYAQCTGQAGDAQLTGSAEMDVVSADHTTSPSTVAVNLTITGLALTLPAGTATLNGTGSVSRSVVAAGGTITTTSRVTVPSETLTTAFNGRSGSFTLSDLDATRTSTSVAGVVTASQYDGHHTLSGSANGRTISSSVSTTGDMNYDASGALVSGAWSVVRPHATIATTVANGTVVLTVDDGSDGSIDHTWTFPLATLIAAAG